jgi:hypothetical protein
MNRREFLKNAGMLIFDKPLDDRDYQSAKNAFTSRNDQMVFTMLSLDDYAKAIDIKIW